MAKRNWEKIQKAGITYGANLSGCLVLGETSQNTWKLYLGFSPKQILFKSEKKIFPKKCLFFSWFVGVFVCLYGFFKYFPINKSTLHIEPKGSILMSTCSDNSPLMGTKYAHQWKKRTPHSLNEQASLMQHYGQVFLRKMHLSLKIQNKSASRQ